MTFVVVVIVAPVMRGLRERVTKHILLLVTGLLVGRNAASRDTPHLLEN
mgnify:CR=1 FL=1